MDFLKTTPREYQKKIHESCMKDNCLVVLPTGLGKTLIALMTAIERMKEFPGEKVVFLAPTKPLAEQHIETFKKNLPELFGELQLFTGKINSEKRKKIWETADIIFSTPQCVANDLKKGLYTLEEVCLLIEDEAHRCLKNYDYNLISKTYQSQSLHPRIMGLTASPGSEKEKIEEICKNLNIKEVELRTRESEDVKKYLQEMEHEKITVNFPPELMELKQILKGVFDEYIISLKEKNLLYGPINKKSLLDLQKRISKNIASGNKGHSLFWGASACAQAIKVQHAIDLLETQTVHSFNQYIKKLFKDASDKKSKGISKLVSREEMNYALMKSTELIHQKKEHPKLQKLVEIIEKEKSQDMKIIVFTQFRDTATIIAKNLNNLKEVNAKVFVGQAKKKSEGEETGLNQKEQRNMIEEFSSGKINVLCATSIAEEGLDIPEVNAVIFYEPITSAIRKIQRSGRTARLSEGKVIMLVTKGTKDESFYYLSRSREKKMYSEIEKIKNKMKNDKQNPQTRLNDFGKNSNKKE